MNNTLREIARVAIEIARLKLELKMLQWKRGFDRRFWEEMEKRAKG